MGRAPCCDKANVKKGPWSPEEDAKLKAYIEKHGTGGNWIALPQKIGLKRCGKSCRLRWLNYLRPNIKHGGFSEEEDNIICSLYISIGSRWSIIAAQLPGRTDNDIKNYWNTRLKKKLLGRRKASGGSKGMSGLVEDNSISNSLSSSALERLQLHMQLQSLQNPFSFYNNPALWPKLHPLQEKMIHTIQSMNRIGTAPTHNPLMQNARTSMSIHTGLEQKEDLMNTNPRVEEYGNSSNGGNLVESSDHLVPRAAFEQTNMGIQPQEVSVCALQAELDEILNNTINTSACDMAVQEDQNQILGSDQLFDCFKEVNGRKDSLIWWCANDSDTKSASSNSWYSTPVLQTDQGIFQNYELGGYNL